MTLLPADSIKTIAEFVGIANLKDDVATALAQDVEYRLRDIIQEAQKFMRHSRRTKLHTEDVNSALRVRNVERLYGFNTSQPLTFKMVPNTASPLFYVDDDEVDFDELLNAPMPRMPLEASCTAHWLAVEGVQPAIPQNPAPTESRVELLSKKLKAEGGKYDLTERRVDVKPLVKHVLSKELQLYYEKIVEAVLSPHTELRDAALESIRDDNGIQQLLPYFVQFITDQMTRNLRNLTLLNTMLMIVDAILCNLNFFVEPYLHQFMPPILSCLVARRLCENPDDHHWSLRHYAAQLMSVLCTKYGASYQTLQPRVTRTLLRAFLDPTKPLTTHYGAIVGLSLMGVDVIKTVLVPNMKAYLDLLMPEIQSPDTHPVKKMEAQRCFLALQDVAIKYLAACNVVDDSMQMDGAGEVTGDQQYIQQMFQLFGSEALLNRPPVDSPATAAATVGE